MGTVVRVQRSMAAKSAQPEDTIVNTLYFLTPTPPDAALCQVIADKVEALFNTPVGAGSAVRTFMAESAFSYPPTSYKFFNMDDAPPRVPFATPNAMNTSPLNTTIAYPSEVAVCLSFRGPLVSGAAAGRRRGRIYIGPLNVNSAAIEVLTGTARPTQALQDALVFGANRLHDDLLTAGATWVVYSPTARGAGAADTAATPITYAWCDNAFDTQRRRGLRPSARTSMTV